MKKLMKHINSHTYKHGRTWNMASFQPRRFHSQTQPPATSSPPSPSTLSPTLSAPNAQPEPSPPPEIEQRKIAPNILPLPAQPERPGRNASAHLSPLPLPAPMPLSGLPSVQNPQPVLYSLGEGGSEIRNPQLKRPIVSNFDQFRPSPDESTNVGMGTIDKGDSPEPTLCEANA